jgi:hypothetical protein
MTDPETLPGYFAANVDRAGIARMIDAYKSAMRERGTVQYDTLPPIEEPHNCLKRGCVLVLKAETPEIATVVERTGVRVSAREDVPRLPVKRDDGDLGGKVGRERAGAIYRLRTMRRDFTVGRELRVWPV